MGVAGWKMLENCFQSTWKTISELYSGDNNQNITAILSTFSILKKNYQTFYI